MTSGRRDEVRPRPRLLAFVRRWTGPVAFAVGSIAGPTLATLVALAPIDGERAPTATILVALGGLTLALVLAFVGGALAGWRVAVSLAAISAIGASIAVALSPPSCASSWSPSCFSRYGSQLTGIAAPIVGAGGVLALFALVGSGLASLKLCMGWHPESGVDPATDSDPSRDLA